MKKFLLITISLILVFTGITECFADEAKPLFKFSYNGSFIETYGAYSIVDGKKCDTHRYFVKDGNLVVIDQDLNPKARDVFIHFANGRSYIAIVNVDGKMISLGTEDLCTKLQGFTNKNIVSLTDNLNSAATTMLFRYEDGSTATYDCLTGKLIEKTEATVKKDPATFVVDYVTDLVDRSTSGFIDASGLKAQSVVVTLNNSGATLEQLIEAGIVNGIAEDYESLKTGDGYEGEVIDYTSELQFEPGTIQNEHVSDLDNSVYDFTQNEAYRQLIESKAAQLSSDQIDALRETFARIAGGESAADIEKENKNLPEDVKKALSSVEEARKEKKFISASEKETYLAVYNAEAKRYDIYSQKTLLKKADDLESENSKLSEVINIDALNKILSSDKYSDAQNGLIVFGGIMGLLVCVGVAVIVFARKSILSKQ